MYSGLSLKRTLPPKVTSFSRSDFQYTMIVNTTNLLLSRKASPLEKTLFITEEVALQERNYCNTKRLGVPDSLLFLLVFSVL